MSPAVKSLLYNRIKSFFDSHITSLAVLPSIVEILHKYEPLSMMITDTDNDQLNY